MFEVLREGLLQAGWVIYPLIGASVIGWYMAFRRLIGLAALQWGGHAAWTRKLSGEDWESVVHGLSARERRTVAGQAIAAIWSARVHGREAMEARLDEVMKFKIPELERHLSTLAVLAGAAPLVGLLGTVAGIIGTFKVISAFGTGNQALMSDSIAESLMATQNGLLVAFPLMIMHVHLAAKADAIEKHALAASHALINRCAPGRPDGFPPRGYRSLPGAPAPALGGRL